MPLEENLQREQLEGYLSESLFDSDLPVGWDTFAYAGPFCDGILDLVRRDWLDGGLDWFAKVGTSVAVLPTVFLLLIAPIVTGVAGLLNWPTRGLILVPFEVVWALLYLPLHVLSYAYWRFGPIAKMLVILPGWFFAFLTNAWTTVSPQATLAIRHERLTYSEEWPLTWPMAHMSRRTPGSLAFWQLERRWFHPHASSFAEAATEQPSPEPPLQTLWRGDELRDDRRSIIYMQAEFTATECLVVPRLIRMHPDWTDEQITEAAAHAMLAAAPATNLRLDTMGAVGEFRAYLAENPMPDISPWSLGGETKGVEILHTAAFWAAMLKEEKGHFAAEIDGILKEWEAESWWGVRRGHPS